MVVPASVLADPAKFPLGRQLPGAVLFRQAPNTVAEAFVASRLGDNRHTLGILPAGVDATALAARVTPAD